MIFLDKIKNYSIEQKKWSKWVSKISNHLGHLWINYQIDRCFNNKEEKLLKICLHLGVEVEVDLLLVEDGLDLLLLKDLEVDLLLPLPLQVDFLHHKDLKVDLLLQADFLHHNRNLFLFQVDLLDQVPIQVILLSKICLNDQHWILKWFKMLQNSLDLKNKLQAWKNNLLLKLNPRFPIKWPV